MNDELKKELIKRTAKLLNINIENYDFLVFSDNEYYMLSKEKENHIEKNFTMIIIFGFVVYYKKA